MFMRSLRVLLGRFNTAMKFVMLITNGNYSNKT
jgi:hypothetical protein